MGPHAGRCASEHPELDFNGSSGRAVPAHILRSTYANRFFHLPPGHVEQHIMQVQAVMDPIAIAGCERRMFSVMGRMQQELVSIRKIMVVAVLCVPHLTFPDMRKFFEVVCTDRRRALFPDFWQHIGNLVATSKPSFQGCALQQASPSTKAEELTLAPFCQCAARAALAPRSPIRGSCLARGGARPEDSIWAPRSPSPDFGLPSIICSRPNNRLVRTNEVFQSHKHGMMF